MLTQRLLIQLTACVQTDWLNYWLTGNYCEYYAEPCPRMSQKSHNYQTHKMLFNNIAVFETTVYNLRKFELTLTCVLSRCDLFPDGLGRVVVVVVGGGRQHEGRGTVWTDCQLIAGHILRKTAFELLEKARDNTDTGILCRLHKDKLLVPRRFRPRTFLLWGNSASHCVVTDLNLEFWTRSWVQERHTAYLLFMLLLTLCECLI